MPPPRPAPASPAATRSRSPAPRSCPRPRSSSVSSRRPTTCRRSCWRAGGTASCASPCSRSLRWRAPACCGSLAATSRTSPATASCSRRSTPPGRCRSRATGRRSRRCWSTAPRGSPRCSAGGSSTKVSAGANCWRWPQVWAVALLSRARWIQPPGGPTRSVSRPAPSRACVTPATASWDARPRSAASTPGRPFSTPSASPPPSVGRQPVAGRHRARNGTPSG